MSIALGISAFNISCHDDKRNEKFGLKRLINCKADEKDLDLRA